MYTTFRARLIQVNFQQTAAIVVAAVVIMTQDELQPLTTTYFHVNKIRGFHKLTTARQTLILMEIKHKIINSKAVVCEKLQIIRKNILVCVDLKLKLSCLFFCLVLFCFQLVVI